LFIKQKLSHSTPHLPQSLFYFLTAREEIIIEEEEERRSRGTFFSSK